jgi:hypothetical protein
MAKVVRVWVEGHTRKDGVKVKGHYREISTTEKASTKRQKQMIEKRGAALGFPKGYYSKYRHLLG